MPKFKMKTTLLKVCQKIDDLEDRLMELDIKSKEGTITTEEMIEFTKKEKQLSNIYAIEIDLIVNRPEGFDTIEEKDGGTIH